MTKNALPLLLYPGLSILTIGTLFRIMHWPGGNLLQSAGLLVELLFFILVIVEVLTSQKATPGTKARIVASYTILPMAAYICLPALLLIAVIFICGTVYLRILRKRVLYSRTEVITKNFDSI